MKTITADTKQVAHRKIVSASVKIKVIFAMLVLTLAASGKNYIVQLIAKKSHADL